MTKFRRCTKCVLPETHETIVFDEEGVCNICRQHEHKKELIDWNVRKRELDRLIDAYRGKHEYDCVVPFSGGKDSTFTLYYLVNEYGIKPLVVRFDHGFFRPNLLENTVRTLRKIGADLHHYTPNWRVAQKLMLLSFLEKGDFCWHCHTGVVAYSMKVAVNEKIPLIFWGEPPSEYTAYYDYTQKYEMDEKHFNRITNLGITSQDMFVRLEGKVDERDLRPYMFPSLKEVRKIGFRSVHLGSYIPWDVKRQAKLIQEELGWKGDEVENVPPGYTYEKIECYLQGVRDYIKYIKRGYTRPSHLASIDIRNHRMKREQAMEMIREHEGRRPPSLNLFLDYVGLREDEFNEIALSHAVSPYRHDFLKTKPGKKVHDFEKWAKHGTMPRQDTEWLLDRWRRMNRASARSVGEG